MVEETFGRNFHMDLTVVDATDDFLEKLQGVTDPEEKRKIIGHEFVEVFRREAKRFDNSDFLGQGTLYPDVIESVNVHGGNTAVIKSHHNVGGLPDDLELELVEPLRELFKDEVRQIGKPPGPSRRNRRAPTLPRPGPRRALPRRVHARAPTRAARGGPHRHHRDRGCEGLHEGLWQYFAVLLPVKSVGVMGDARTYEEACAIRVVQSEDAMTADWVSLPHDLLARISNRIMNEVRGINRVVLDISSKPPATIEWE